MPALVNRSVGSLAGTSDDECTSLCPFSTKKSRNFLRICDPVSMKFNSKRNDAATHDPEQTGHRDQVYPAILCALLGGLRTLLSIFRCRLGAFFRFLRGSLGALLGFLCG